MAEKEKTYEMFPLTAQMYRCRVCKAFAPVMLSQFHSPEEKRPKCRYCALANFFTDWCVFFRKVAIGEVPIGPGEDERGIICKFCGGEMLDEGVEGHTDSCFYEKMISDERYQDVVWGWGGSELADWIEWELEPEESV